MRLFYLLFGLFITLASPVFADIDEGLYAPVPPEDSTFVRFINVAPGVYDLLIKIGGKSYKSLSLLEVSPYYVMPPGPLEFGIGNDILQKDTVPGNHYTVVLVDEDKEPLFFKDNIHTNRAKAFIKLYNLESFTPASLKTLEQKNSIIEDVEYGKVGIRAVNAVKLSAGIYELDTEKTQLKPIFLQRGKSYSVIYIGEDSFWVQDKIDTRQ